MLNINLKEKFKKKNSISISIVEIFNSNLSEKKSL